MTHSILSAAAVVIAAVIGTFALEFLIKKITGWLTRKDLNAIRESRSTLQIKTLSNLIRWIGNIAIIVLATYIILDAFGVNVMPILAGFSVMGVAVGFASQYLIRDIITGIVLLIEGQYAVNDVVKIGNEAGLVEEINLRVTKLRDLSGRLIFVPNGEVKTVINFTKDFSYALIDIGVAYKENIDKVIEELKKIGSEMRKDSSCMHFITADLEMLGVEEFADSQVKLRLRIKTLPIKQWEVAREFRRRVKNRFDELGIEIPFPHRTVYWGTGAENDWFKELVKSSGWHTGNG